MENIDLMKTPSRTRKSSVDIGGVSTKKRSVIKETIREIEETDNVFNNKDLMTPRRATRTLDFQTPSRSEALIGNQTPRRSVRKSFKPVQEYENIVAQKGLSAKRSAFTLPNEESEVVEAGPKWEPSVIGRASTKRAKKSKRSKKQKKDEKEKAEVQESVLSNEDKEDENMIGDENKQTSNLIEQVNDAENIVITNMDQDKQSTEIMNLQTLQIDEHVADLSDTSIANGDALMSVMPITGDDCINSPEKTSPLCPKMSNVSVVIESTNKSDESDDCVMLSFNGTLSPATKCDNVSRDSAELNMPALLVCSDDEDDVEFVDASPSIELEVEKKIENCENTQLNSTFDAEEKDEFVVALSDPNQTKRVQEPEENVQETLSLAEVKQIIGDPNKTFDADEVPIENVPITVTPSHVKIARPSARTVTPFKLKQTVVPDIIIEHEEEIQNETIPEIFLMEPKETKLYSIRKRSNSLCIDRPKKNVRFHSPSNTTVLMSLHVDLAQSARKNDPHKDITKRRKRSMSVTETEKEFLDYIQHKKTARETPQKKQQVSRIKMPNFSAIHLKQFRKMESITDHVARRAERAKVLINSNTKVKPASIQKSFIKNSILRDQNVDKSGTKSLLPKPKARQRIELSGIEHKPTNDSRLKDLPQIRKTPNKVFEKSRFVFDSTSKANQLPKPMFNFTFHAEKNPINPIKLKNSSTLTVKPTTAISTIAGTSAGPIQRLPNPKKDFNLSTAITESHINRGADKVDERRKRMMDMFKSRGTQRKDKNKEILKGVRTNRRFELQMMCRNRPPN